jgi:hypothetical protein
MSDTTTFTAEDTSTTSVEYSLDHQAVSTIAPADTESPVDTLQTSFAAELPPKPRKHTMSNARYLDMKAEWDEHKSIEEDSEQ